MANQRVDQFKKVELIRRSVKEVQDHAKELEEQRKLKGKAYDGVKSKIARNMKVTDKVNRDRGYANPRRRGSAQLSNSSAVKGGSNTLNPPSNQGENEQNESYYQESNNH